MDDLAAFIEARLAEDEMLSAELHRAEWCNSADRDGGYEAGRCDCGYPSRVLREVAAKRAIVATHGRDNFGCQSCEHHQRCPVPLLAAIWSGHPDYRAEWAPA